MYPREGSVPKAKARREATRWLRQRASADELIDDLRSRPQPIDSATQPATALAKSPRRHKVRRQPALR